MLGHKWWPAELDISRILYLARMTVGSSFSRAGPNHAQLTFTRPTGSAECKIAMLSFVHNFLWYSVIPDLGFFFGLTLHATCLVLLGLVVHSAGPILVQGREQAGMIREIPKACARATGTVDTIVFTAPDALFFFSYTCLFCFLCKRLYFWCSEFFTWFPIFFLVWICTIAQPRAQITVWKFHTLRDRRAGTKSVPYPREVPQSFIHVGALCRIYSNLPRTSSCLSISLFTLLVLIQRLRTQASTTNPYTHPPHSFVTFLCTVMMPNRDVNRRRLFNREMHYADHRRYLVSLADASQLGHCANICV